MRGQLETLRYQTNPPGWFTTFHSEPFRSHTHALESSALNNEGCALWSK